MIAIVSACGTNLTSVQAALARLCTSTQITLTTDPDTIRSASHVILPGVGTAKYAMTQLEKWDLIETIRGLKQPVLGICLGMQILFEHSAEGEIPYLQIIPGRVEKLLQLPTFTLPHMGWNQLEIAGNQSFLFRGISDHSYVYYVHGYGVPVCPYTLATTYYSSTFSAIVQYQNFYGMQFHPERSGKVGAQLLQNFLET